MIEISSEASKLIVFLNIRDESDKIARNGDFHSLMIAQSKFEYNASIFGYIEDEYGFTEDLFNWIRIDSQVDVFETPPEETAYLTYGPNGTYYLDKNRIIIGRTPDIIMVNEPKSEEFKLYENTKVFTKKPKESAYIKTGPNGSFYYLDIDDNVIGRSPDNTKLEDILSGRK